MSQTVNVLHYVYHVHVYVHEYMQIYKYLQGSRASRSASERPSKFAYLANRFSSSSQLPSARSYDGFASSSSSSSSPSSSPSSFPVSSSSPSSSSSLARGGLGFSPVFSSSPVSSSPPARGGPECSPHGCDQLGHLSATADDVGPPGGWRGGSCWEHQEDA